MRDVKVLGNVSPDIYIERNLSLMEFAAWARGTLPDSTRLRSVIGPPGSGKSTFLRHLQALLREEQRALFIDLATPPNKHLADRLHDALDANAQEWQISFVSDRSVQFAAAFDAFMHNVAGRPIILLVDGIEGVSPELRAAVETQVLEPFLFPPGPQANERHAVLARQDEYGLSSALLRWEEEVQALDGLASAEPEEQIRQLFKAIVAAGDTPKDLMRCLGSEEQEQPLTGKEAREFFARIKDNGGEIVAGLTPYLTPNPYINLVLVRRQLLLQPDDKLGADDYRAALVSYMRRAGLPAIYDPILFDHVPLPDERGESGLSEYLAAGIFAELEAFMAAGIIAQTSTNRYRLEPAVARLLRQLRPEAAR